MRYVDCSPQAKYISKKTGQSAVAKHDYITRSNKYARVADRAVMSEAVNLPAFAQGDARIFWAAADAHERKDGKLLYEYIMPLPVGLSEKMQVSLCRKFTKTFLEKFDSGAPVVEWALHEGHGSNPHMHFIYSTRLVTESTAQMESTLFFKRGGPQLSFNDNGKNHLAKMKKEWLAWCNGAAGKAGLPVRLVGGSLEKQRDLAAGWIENYKNARDRENHADAQWWWLKTHRPVTSHRGPASNAETEGAADRRARYRAEAVARDAFLEEAATAFVEICEAKGKPIPEEAAELARKHAKRRVAATVENFDTAAALHRDIIAGAIAALDAAPAPKQPAKSRVRQPQQEKNMQQLKPTTIEIDTGTGPRPGKTGRARIGEDLAGKAGRATLFKSSLWKQIYGREIAESAAAAISYIHRDERIIQTWSKEFVQDRGEEIYASKIDAMTLQIMIEQARAKGWTRIEIVGENKIAADAFSQAGFEVSIVAERDENKPESADKPWLEIAETPAEQLRKLNEARRREKRKSEAEERRRSAMMPRPRPRGF